MTFSFKIKKINLADLAAPIQKVYNAYNKNFKNIYFYIYFTEKIKIFTKNSDISLRKTKVKKYAKYIKNMPIYIQNNFLNILSLKNKNNLKILF